LLYGSENLTSKARDARRITAVDMKHMRTTAVNTWTDYETNTEITKELHMTLVLEEIQDYTIKWIGHINRTPCNRLTRLIRKYSKKAEGIREDH
jgi:hypothetical protein